MRSWLACLALAATSGAALTCTLLSDALADGTSDKAAKPGYLADRLRRPGFLMGGAAQRDEHAKRSWEHVAQTDGAACRAALTANGTRFKPMPDQAAPSPKTGCGIPHGVIVTRGPSGITYSPPLVVDCSLAIELPKVEAVLQEEATRHLGGPLTRVTTLGSYSCRPVRGWKERISQHALGNAIDLAVFHPKRGRAATVARDYARTGADPASGQSRFLAAIFRRLRSETGVTRVLGPDWDAQHRNHFHLDRGLRGWHALGV